VGTGGDATAALGDRPSRSTATLSGAEVPDWYLAAMLDVRRIRSDYDAVAASLARRGPEHGPMLAEVRQLDERQRALSAERDEVRQQVKALSKQVGQLRRDGRDADAAELQDESRRLGDRERELDAEVSEVADAVRDLLLRIPNTPSPDVPDGADEHDNVVVRVENFDEASYGAHQRVPHWDIGPELGILDLERGAKVSGSMFVMLRGLGATLSRALCQLALDRNSDIYEEIRPPSLVLSRTLTATGQLPKFADDAYHVERDDLWAIPTAEVPLTSIGMGEVLPEADLPRRFMAYSPCFRREAGSAGRDTRGLLRVHEFDKVELLAYATPDQAPALLDEILGRAEQLVRDLGLAHRVLEICTGDLGQSHHRSFDIEVYAPGADQWLEVSSISWFSDYQARRADLRYRPTGAKSNELLHTLNGSALAVPRIWASVVETHRQPDGSILLPSVLHPYLRGHERIPAPARVASGDSASDDDGGRGRGATVTTVAASAANDATTEAVPADPDAAAAAPTSTTRSTTVVPRSRWGAIAGLVVLAYVVVWAAVISQIANRNRFNRWGAAFGSLGARVVMCVVVLAALFHTFDGLRRSVLVVAPTTRSHDVVLRAGVRFATWVLALPCAAAIIWPWVAETRR
jgi:seryl-tRNA synthetase